MGLAAGAKQEPDRDLLHAHFLYTGDFFRSADYPFPRERQVAVDYVSRVDDSLSGDAYAAYWRNTVSAAQDLDVPLVPDELEAFLSPHVSEFLINALFEPTAPIAQDEGR